MALCPCHPGSVFLEGGGVAASARLQRDRVLEAINIGLSRLTQSSGRIHHSHPGSQYASTDFQQAFREHEIVCSMSGRGNGDDNAVAKRFFAALKRECVKKKTYRTRTEAKADLFFTTLSFSTTATGDIQL